MTREEAKFYFQDCKEDLVDCYEERLFEYKQFFATRPIISKLFLSKIESLQSINAAFDVLSAAEVGENIIDTKVKFDFNDNMLESFNLFYKIKNELKQAVFATYSGYELIAHVNELLYLHKCFAEHVTSYYTAIEENIKVTEEPDPIVIIRELKSLAQKHIIGFYQLDVIKDTNPVTKEIKRLHLWRQY